LPHQLKTSFVEPIITGRRIAILELPTNQQSNWRKVLSGQNYIFYKTWKTNKESAQSEKSYQLGCIISKKLIFSTVPPDKKSSFFISSVIYLTLINFRLPYSQNFD
jgi:hypothetical protein